LDILCCENHRDAAGLLRETMAASAPGLVAGGDYGFVNTIVARMCQNLTRTERDLEPLTPDVDTVMVVEAWEPFPLDRDALVGSVPEIAHLEPVPAGVFLAYEHRKLYAHNGVHALLSALGKMRGFEHYYQVADDAEIDRVGRRAMWEEIGAALVRAHPEVFTREGMDEFAEDLYGRLVDPVFADRIERGAKDTLRMIRPEDGRLSTAALFAAEQGLEPRAMSLGVAAVMEDHGVDREGLEPALAGFPAAATAVLRELVDQAHTALAAERAGATEALSEFLAGE
jgi:mannitol-1-phosphate/altronate dehydrogenase